MGSNLQRQINFKFHNARLLIWDYSSFINEGVKAVGLTGRMRTAQPGKVREKVEERYVVITSILLFRVNRFKTKLFGKRGESPDREETRYIRLKPYLAAE